MKRELGLFIFIAAALSLAPLPPGPARAHAHSPDVWAGTYESTTTLGQTAGGTPMVVTYTIDITSANAELGALLGADGYMTDDRLRCTTRTVGNRISLYFHSYPDGGTANQYGVELYRKGDLLLSLDKVTQQQRTRYRVTWAKYNTDLKRRIFFRKTA